MEYLIYIMCSLPLVWYLETLQIDSFVFKAFSTLNLFEKIILYLMPMVKEAYIVINFIEKQKPEWFLIKNDI